MYRSMLVWSEFYSTTLHYYYYYFFFITTLHVYAFRYLISYMAPVIFFREAAEDAGFDVLRVISQPATAALAYGKVKESVF